MKLYTNMSDAQQNSSHLSQLGKTIQARKNLKNKFKAKQLENLGLYEQAARIQEPITKTITETSEGTKKELEKVLNAIENQPQPLGALLPPPQQPQVPIVIAPEDAEILNIINNETERSPGLTNNTLSHINTINNVKAFTIGSGKRENYLV
jgi:hypothetical protein